MKKVYFDHTAGMPVDPQVFEAMKPYFNHFYSNPSSLHSLAQEVRRGLQNAREEVSELIGAKNGEEIFFTSCATESNNWAIRGVASRNRDRGKHIITTTIEHMSVMNVCKYLIKQGYKASFLPVDNYGLVDLEALQKELTDDTILVSVMYANGEIGTIEPVKEISEVVHDKGVYLHVDATAAAGQVDLIFKRHVWTERSRCSLRKEWNAFGAPNLWRWAGARTSVRFRKLAKYCGHGKGSGNRKSKNEKGKIKINQTSEHVHQRVVGDHFLLFSKWPPY